MASTSRSCSSPDRSPINRTPARARGRLHPRVAPHFDAPAPILAEADSRSPGRGAQPSTVVGARRAECRDQIQCLSARADLRLDSPSPKDKQPRVLDTLRRITRYIPRQRRRLCRLSIAEHVSNCAHQPLSRSRNLCGSRAKWPHVPSKRAPDAPNEDSRRRRPSQLSPYMRTGRRFVQSQQKVTVRWERNRAACNARSSVRPWNILLHEHPRAADGSLLPHGRNRQRESGAATHSTGECKAAPMNRSEGPGNTGDCKAAPQQYGRPGDSSDASGRDRQPASQQR